MSVEIFGLQITCSPMLHLQVTVQKFRSNKVCKCKICPKTENKWPLLESAIDQYCLASIYFVTTFPILPARRRKEKDGNQCTIRKHHIAHSHEICIMKPN